MRERLGSERQTGRRVMGVLVMRGRRDDSGAEPRKDTLGMSTASPARVCRIIAGPNGAGKTTFALKYLPQVAPGTAFVNADLIAAGLSPLAPEQQ